MKTMKLGKTAIDISRMALDTWSMGGGAAWGGGLAGHRTGGPADLSAGPTDLAVAAAARRHRREPGCRGADRPGRRHPPRCSGPGGLAPGIAAEPLRFTGQRPGPMARAVHPGRPADHRFLPAGVVVGLAHVARRQTAAQQPAAYAQFAAARYRPGRRPAVGADGGRRRLPGGAGTALVYPAVDAGSHGHFHGPDRHRLRWWLPAVPE